MIYVIQNRRTLHITITNKYTTAIACKLCSHRSATNREEGKGRETGDNMFTVSPVQSVVSLDSVAAGADFIEFE
jgi:hypothetical protein